MGRSTTPNHAKQHPKNKLSLFLTHPKHIDAAVTTAARIESSRHRIFANKAVSDIKSIPCVQFTTAH